MRCKRAGKLATTRGMRLVRLALGFGLLGLAVPACGGSSSSADAGPDAFLNGGFQLPSASTKANMEVTGTWTELGPAEWSCLGTASTDTARTVALNLMGQAQDFQNMDSSHGIANTTVTVFDDIDYMNPFQTVTSDNMGKFTVTIPTGKKRVGFKLHGGTLGTAAYMDTFLLNQYWDAAATDATINIGYISEGLATALPAFTGLERTPGTGVLAGAFRDCAGHEVSNAIATVSSTSGTATELPGADTYYISASAGLPVNHKQLVKTDKNGVFAVFQLPEQSGTAYIQVWGFKDDAALAQGQAGLTLLAELPSPVLSDNVITGSIEPLRN
jgi:hypothetical protein